MQENATELAKRTTVAGCKVALEQKNLRLRVQLQQTEARIVKLSKSETKSATGSMEPRATRARTNKDQPLSAICPKPPKAAAKVYGTRASKRGDQGEDNDPSKVLLRVEAMAKEVAKLRQEVTQIGQGRAIVRRTSRGPGLQKGDLAGKAAQQKK